MIISKGITYSFPPSVPKKELSLLPNILTRWPKGVKAKLGFLERATLTDSTAGRRKQPSNQRPGPLWATLGPEETSPGAGALPLSGPCAYSIMSMGLDV